jgi:capsular polysaccharide biosynthesis protein
MLIPTANFTPVSLQIFNQLKRNSMKINPQQLKNLVLAILLMVALYLTYIFVVYWDVIAEAFMAGWHSV